MHNSLEDRYIVIPRNRLQRAPGVTRELINDALNRLSKHDNDEGRKPWKGLVVRDSWPIYPFVEALLLEWLGQEEPAGPQNLAMDQAALLPMGLPFRQALNEASRQQAETRELLKSFLEALSPSMFRDVDPEEGTRRVLKQLAKAQYPSKVTLAQRVVEADQRLEERTELLRRLIAANGGHGQGEDWAAAVARMEEEWKHRFDRNRRFASVLGIEFTSGMGPGDFAQAAADEVQRLKTHITSLEQQTDEFVDDIQVMRSALEAVATEILGRKPPFMETSNCDLARDVESSVADRTGKARKDRIDAVYRAMAAPYGTGTEAPKVTEPRSAYDRLVVQRETGESLYLDPYEILDAFRTENPALDHVVKKALVPGQRGHKDRMTDLRDIEWSAKLARQQEEARLQGMTSAEAAAKPYAELAKDFAKSPWFRVGPEQIMSIEEARHCEKVARMAWQFGEGAIKAHTDANMSREEAEKLLDAYRNTAGKVLQLHPEKATTAEEAERISRSLLRKLFGGYESEQISVKKIEETDDGVRFILEPVELSFEEAQSHWSAIREGEQARKQSERMRAITEFARKAENLYPGSGYVSRGECRRWAENQIQGNPTMVGELIENVRLNQLPVVFTGAPAGVSRKDVKDLLDAFDIAYRGSVSVDTGFLVLAPKGHSSVKVEAAEEHGVPILMWSELVAWAKAEAGK